MSDTEFRPLLGTKTSVTLVRGTSRTLELQITDVDSGEPIDLTSATLYFSVSTKGRPSVPVVYKDSTNAVQIEIVDAKGGLAAVHIYPADTYYLQESNYAYDVLMDIGTDRYIVIEQSDFFVRPITTQLPLPPLPAAVPAEVPFAGAPPRFFRFELALPQTVDGVQTTTLYAVPAQLTGSKRLVLQQLWVLVRQEPVGAGSHTLRIGTAAGLQDLLEDTVIAAGSPLAGAVLNLTPTASRWSTVAVLTPGEGVVARVTPAGVFTDPGALTVYGYGQVLD